MIFFSLQLVIILNTDKENITFITRAVEANTKYFWHLSWASPGEFSGEWRKLHPIYVKISRTDIWVQAIMIIDALSPIKVLLLFRTRLDMVGLSQGCIYLGW